MKEKIMNIFQMLIGNLIGFAMIGLVIIGIGYFVTQEEEFEFFVVQDDLHFKDLSEADDNYIYSEFLTSISLSSEGFTNVKATYDVLLNINANDFSEYQDEGVLILEVRDPSDGLISSSDELELVRINTSIAGFDITNKTGEFIIKSDNNIYSKEDKSQNWYVKLYYIKNDNHSSYINNSIDLSLDIITYDPEGDIIKEFILGK